MKNYYLEESIDALMEDLDSRKEALEHIEAYFKMNFPKEELLELLIRGQIHAMADERTEGYYNV